MRTTPINEGQKISFRGKPFGRIIFGARDYDSYEMELVIDIPSVVALLDRHLFPETPFELGAEVIALTSKLPATVRGKINARHHAQYADGSELWTYEIASNTDDGAIVREMEHRDLILVTGEAVYVDPTPPPEPYREPTLTGDETKTAPMNPALRLVEGRDA